MDMDAAPAELVALRNAIQDTDPGRPAAIVLVRGDVPTLRCPPANLEVVWSGAGYDIWRRHPDGGVDPVVFNLSIQGALTAMTRTGAAQ